MILINVLTAFKIQESPSSFYAETMGFIIERANCLNKNDRIMKKVDFAVDDVNNRYVDVCKLQIVLRITTKYMNCITSIVC